MPDRRNRIIESWEAILIRFLEELKEFCELEGIEQKEETRGKGAME